MFKSPGRSQVTLRSLLLLTAWAAIGLATIRASVLAGIAFFLATTPALVRIRNCQRRTGKTNGSTLEHLRMSSDQEESSALGACEDSVATGRVSRILWLRCAFIFAVAGLASTASSGAMSAFHGRSVGDPVLFLGTAVALAVLGSVIGSVYGALLDLFIRPCRLKIQTRFLFWGVLATSVAVSAFNTDFPRMGRPLDAPTAWAAFAMCTILYTTVVLYEATPSDGPQTN